MSRVRGTLSVNKTWRCQNWNGFHSFRLCFVAAPGWNSFPNSKSNSQEALMIFRRGTNHRKPFFLQLILLLEVSEETQDEVWRRHTRRQTVFTSLLTKHKYDNRKPTQTHWLYIRWCRCAAGVMQVWCRCAAGVLQVCCRQPSSQLNGTFLQLGKLQLLPWQRTMEDNED